MREKALLMDEQAVNRAIARIAHEIIERNKGAGGIALVGIRRRGVPLAESIADCIRRFDGTKPLLGALDITLYRDDLRQLADYPRLNSTEISFDVAGRDIVLVDDVLFTGRTARAGMDALIALGRPRTVQLAVLIDRGHRELPIRADYVGKNIPTSGSETVKVYCGEIDGETCVRLFERHSQL